MPMMIIIIDVFSDVHDVMTMMMIIIGVSSDAHDDHHWCIFLIQVGLFDLLL